MATGTQAEQREALKAQLQAEMEAQLATYEAEAKANAEKQKAGYQKNIDDANNSYAAYETQTNANMAKSIEDMLKQYNNDSVRRGMARSSYALDRGTEGESSIREEVARALAAQKATTDSGIRNYQDLINLIASQTDANIAAQKQAAQKTINSNLSNFDLSFLQQQQDLENQKELLTFQNNLKSSGGGSGGSSGGSGAGVNPYAAALTSTGITEEQRQKDLARVAAAQAPTLKASQDRITQLEQAAKKKQQAINLQNDAYRQSQGWK